MNLLSSRFVSRAACLAVGSLILGLVLPGCEFHSGVLPLKHRTYRIAGATVRNLTDGREFTFGYGDAVLDPPARYTIDFPSLSEGDTSPETAADLDNWFKRYLKQQLEARAAEATPNSIFVALYGQGSEWCLLASPTITQTSLGELSGGVSRPAITEEEELPACVDPPMHRECQNAPGMMPVLQLDPSPLTFPDTGLGFDSGFRPVTLRNMGTGTLCLLPGGLEGTDASEHFTLDPGSDTDPGSCTPHNGNNDELEATRVLLDSGESCQVNVRFHPRLPGVRTAFVPIVSNDPTPGMARLEVSGRGLGGELRVVSVDPGSSVTHPGSLTRNAEICAGPYVAEFYRTFVNLGNLGPGVVILTSLPPDTGPWRIPAYDVVQEGVVVSAYTAAPVVLLPGQELRFGAGGEALPPTPASLFFHGTQQNSPFEVVLERRLMCP